MQKINRVTIFIAFVVVAFAFGWIFHVKPPFMSPDEGVHLSRADALRNGSIFLSSPDGRQDSGGYVDENMYKFRSMYDFFIRGHDAELANQFKRDMQNLHWSNKEVFYGMPAATFYFPAIYLPQAVGLQLGHWLNLSVFSTYKLVSAFTLFIGFLLVVFAWKIYPVPTPALAVLLLPMSLFQLFSPTIDGLTFALTILTMSLFFSLRKLNDERVFNKYMLFFSICIFILSSSKANMLPLILMPAWLYIKTRKKICLSAFAITSVLVLLWTFIAIKTVNDKGINHPGMEQIDVLKHYVSHPFEVFSIIGNTLSDYQIVVNYLISFIGKLGWLDVALPDFAYLGFGIFLYTIFILNLKKVNITERKQEFAFLVFLFLSIVILIFCALLVQWSPFPTERVEGVQGRYFIVPLIILGYAIKENPAYRKASLYALIVMGIFSVKLMHSALKARYF